MRVVVNSSLAIHWNLNSTVCIQHRLRKLATTRCNYKLFSALRTASRPASRAVTCRKATYRRHFFPCVGSSRSRPPNRKRSRPPRVLADSSIRSGSNAGPPDALVPTFRSLKKTSDPLIPPDRDPSSLAGSGNVTLLTPWTGSWVSWQMRAIVAVSQQNLASLEVDGIVTCR